MGNASFSNCEQNTCQRSPSSNQSSCSGKSGSSLRKINVVFKQKASCYSFSNDIHSNCDSKSIPEAKMNSIIKGNIDRQMRKCTSSGSCTSRRPPSERELDRIVKEKISKAKRNSCQSCETSPSGQESCGLEKRNQPIRRQLNNKQRDDQSGCCGGTPKPKLWKSLVQSNMSDKSSTSCSNCDKSDIDTDFEDRSVASFQSRLSRRQEPAPRGCCRKQTNANDQQEAARVSSDSRAILESKRKRLLCVSDDFIKKSLRVEGIKDSSMKSYCGSCVDEAPSSFSEHLGPINNGNSCRRKFFTSTVNSEPHCSNQTCGRNSSLGHRIKSKDQTLKQCGACNRSNYKQPRKYSTSSYDNDQQSEVSYGNGLGGYTSAADVQTIAESAGLNTSRLRVTSRPASFTQLNSQNSHRVRTPTPRLTSDTSLTHDFNNHVNKLARAPSYTTSRTSVNSLHSNNGDTFDEYSLSQTGSRHLSPNPYQKPKGFTNNGNTNDFRTSIFNNSAICQPLSPKQERKTSHISQYLFRDKSSDLKTHDFHNVNSEDCVQPTKNVVKNLPDCSLGFSDKKESMPSRVYVFSSGSDNACNVSDIEKDINNILNAFGDNYSPQTFAIESKENLGKKIKNNNSAQGALLSETDEIATENNDITLSTHYENDTSGKKHTECKSSLSQDGENLRGMVEATNATPLNKEVVLHDSENLAIVRQTNSDVFILDQQSDRN